MPPVIRATLLQLCLSLGALVLIQVMSPRESHAQRRPSASKVKEATKQHICIDNLHFISPGSLRELTNNTCFIKEILQWGPRTGKGKKARWPVQVKMNIYLQTQSAPQTALSKRKGMRKGDQYITIKTKEYLGPVDCTARYKQKNRYTSKKIVAVDCNLYRIPFRTYREEAVTKRAPESLEEYAKRKGIRNIYNLRLDSKFRPDEKFYNQGGWTLQQRVAQRSNYKGYKYEDVSLFLINKAGTTALFRRHNISNDTVALDYLKTHPSNSKTYVMFDGYSIFEFMVTGNSSSSARDLFRTVVGELPPELPQATMTMLKGEIFEKLQVTVIDHKVVPPYLKVMKPVPVDEEQLSRFLQEVGWQFVETQGSGMRKTAYYIPQGESRITSSISLVIRIHHHKTVLEAEKTCKDPIHYMKKPNCIIIGNSNIIYDIEAGDSRTQKNQAKKALKTLVNYLNLKAK